jgi:hypothetical protein
MTLQVLVARERWAGSCNAEYLNNAGLNREQSEAIEPVSNTARLKYARDGVGITYFHFAD